MFKPKLCLAPPPIAHVYSIRSSYSTSYSHNLSNGATFDHKRDNGMKASLMVNNHGRVNIRDKNNFLPPIAHK